MDRTLLLALIALTACQPDAGPPDDSPSKAASPEPAREHTPATVAEPTHEKTPQRAHKEAPKPSADEARALRRSLLAKLNEGRALTKSAEYGEAILRFREVLKIDPGHVSALAELGWAAYLAGDLELAHRNTTAALRFAAKDKQIGMLLYNLGRIDEDRGQTATAIERYRQSLARRSNATVRARLDALLAARDTAKTQVEREATREAEFNAALRGGLPILGADLPGLDATCKLIEREACDDYSLDADQPCRCEPELLAAPGADPSWGLLYLAVDGVPMEEAWFPVVQTDGGWTAFESVLYSYNPGAFGIFEEAEIHPTEVKPLLGPQGGSQLILRMAKQRSDSDMGVNEGESEVHDSLVICGRFTEGARCTRPVLERFSYERFILFEEFEEEGEEEFDHEGSLGASSYGATIRFADGGQLVVAQAEVDGAIAVPSVDWSGNLTLAKGSYALRELLGLSASPP